MNSEGRLQWYFDTGHQTKSSPTVVNSTVYTGSCDYSVYALDSDDGTEQWHFETGDAVKTSPAVTGRTVCIGSDDGNVYALDADDGSKQWRFKTDDSVSSSPTVADGTIFVGSRDHNVYALDADDGSEQWHFETGFSVVSSPIVVDGTVFVGSDDNNVYALDADSGAEQWHYETGIRVTSSPTVVDGTVFVGSRDGIIYALDAENGSEQWKFKTNLWISSSPTVAGGVVFVGSADRGVYALDADDGSKKWRFETGDRVTSSPTIAGGIVFVGSEDNHVYALDADDGSEQWQFETGDEVPSSPTVVDGTIFIGSRDNKVYALNADINDSSEDSRVCLGTLGHHHVHASNIQSSNKESGATTATTSNTTNSRSAALGDSIDQSLPIVEDHGTRIPTIDAATSPPRHDIDFIDLQVEVPVESGGQATVYKATIDGIDDPKHVAIRAPQTLFADRQTVEQTSFEPFLDRAQTWARINRREQQKRRWDHSDHIVGVVAVGDRLPWIALEFMNGGSLAEQLESGTAFNLPRALWTAEKLAQGLEVAHNEGVVHLDLKPPNILFRATTDDTWPVPKIADWGLARALAEETKTVDWVSPKYAAPEILSPESFGPPDSLTDVYQLGAVLYAMLTGRPPYDHGDARRVLFRVVEKELPPPPSEYVPDLSPAVDRAVLTALAPNKRDRYGSAREFKQALNALRTGATLPSVLTEPSNETGPDSVAQQSERRNKKEYSSQQNEQETTGDTVDADRLPAEDEVFGEITSFESDGIVTIDCKDNVDRIAFIPDIPPGKSLVVGSVVIVQPYEWESHRATIEHIYDDERASEL